MEPSGYHQFQPLFRYVLPNLGNLERIENEQCNIRFDEFGELIKLDSFTSKEPTWIRVRSLQISIVDPSTPAQGPGAWEQRGTRIEAEPLGRRE